jgi:hypothetical protein
MLMFVSPAKSLDFDTPTPKGTWRQPQFLKQAEALVEILRPMTPAELGRLMKLSDKLAQLNAARYAQWKVPFDEEMARPAIFAFTGDVYRGLDARNLSEDQLGYVFAHLRILSGLYGVLRPDDLMMAYRLEMGTKLANPAGDDLYAYWRVSLTEHVIKEIEAQSVPAVVNLASNEYAKAIDWRKLPVPVIEPVFKDWKNGGYKIISFFAKWARGAMVRYAALLKAETPEALKGFDIGGYTFDPEQSTDTKWVFLRRQV